MRQPKRSVPQLRVLCNQVPFLIQQWPHICLLLVTCVLAEALLVEFDIPCQIQFQVQMLAFLTMHADGVSIFLQGHLPLLPSSLLFLFVSEF